MTLDEAGRDVESIRLGGWGKVARGEGLVPWLVIGPDGQPVEPIRRYLSDFVARGNAAGSVRSYACALHRWWRFLLAIGVEWDKATSAEARGSSRSANSFR